MSLGLKIRDPRQLRPGQAQPGGGITTQSAVSELALRDAYQYSREGEQNFNYMGNTARGHRITENPEELS